MMMSHKPCCCTFSSHNKLDCTHNTQKHFGDWKNTTANLNIVYDEYKSNLDLKVQYSGLLLRAGGGSDDVWLPKNFSHQHIVNGNDDRLEYRLFITQHWVTRLLQTHYHKEVPPGGRSVSMLTSVEEQKWSASVRFSGHVKTEILHLLSRNAANLPQLSESVRTNNHRKVFSVTFVGFQRHHLNGLI